MKITQEVRDYAAAQEAEATAKEAEEGMKAMSEQFRDSGSEIYHKL